jgi:hypothetical protein
MTAKNKTEPGKPPRVPGRRNPGAVGTVHSIRCTDDLWKAAKDRADQEGVTMNYVITEIMEGYALGAMDLPSVEKAWTQTREVVPA